MWNIRGGGGLDVGQEGTCHIRIFNKVTCLGNMSNLDVRVILHNIQFMAIRR